MKSQRSKVGKINDVLSVGEITFSEPAINIMLWGNCFFSLPWYKRIFYRIKWKIEEYML